MKWGLWLTAAALLFAGYLLALPPEPDPGSAGAGGTASPSPSPGRQPHKSRKPHPKPPAPATPVPTELPFGGLRIPPNLRLVAYYGTAGTGSLGVLGERSIPVMTQRLRAAAKPFARPGRPVQIVYELIVTVADGHPGEGRDFSHDIDRAKVQTFIDAAHRNQALLVLDLQPGRDGFLEVAKRWAWALRDPWVSLALDPEWRVHGKQVPARVIGSVTAAEVNRVGAWLNHLTATHELPDKLLLLHQFRTQMIRDIGRIADRPRLVEVQHVDGFGNRRQKLGTYHHVERHQQFRMGFKLFYDEDTRLFPPWQVLRIRPAVGFVSYQ
ncbi:exported hypothetical protein [metagenome]|uniref:Lipoprotein n=1 Tax=metagenome TaxID=256318 RepID=A0A2P2C3E3_9ZZZZ